MRTACQRGSAEFSVSLADFRLLRTGAHMPPALIAASQLDLLRHSSERQPLVDTS